MKGKMNKTYKKLIIGLGLETIIMGIVLIILLKIEEYILMCMVAIFVILEIACIVLLAKKYQKDRKTKSLTK
ncbi:hypothetical protein SAMN05216351_1293 [Pseudobutyrivibrio sp. JW11]|uniref:hypothetical protein n=1 Tax=Pseudobutyrivibrio sp. JW11 TaxID=1855302 RepID=UPI0008E1E5D1|nr:hypothetical protein [Pseudobutyrivibrio sp. JW11]SFO67020.1 hypothetical protein SAMN05216351_1293 [Pseudobutyrivibrio sp. JW11]